jgi:hypothetical protein
MTSKGSRRNRSGASTGSRPTRVAGRQDAGLAWESLIRGGLDRDEHQRVRKALLDYSGRDTLALIKLVERLQVAST